ncbi:hypothetical protein ACP275_11G016200 [Erythranthe tilingii]
MWIFVCLYLFGNRTNSKKLAIALGVRTSNYVTDFRILLQIFELCYRFSGISKTSHLKSCKRAASDVDSFGHFSILSTCIFPFFFIVVFNNYIQIFIVVFNIFT